MGIKGIDLIDLSIIIVSWNVADLLEACLKSIYDSDFGKYTLEVIVVDSGSQDDSVARVRSTFPQAKLVTQAENTGYTHSNNIGLEIAQGRFLFLLNPDTQVISNAMHQLVAFLDENPSIGIVGPHTLNADGSYQSTKRRFPTLITGLVESTWMQSIAPQHYFDDYYATDIGNDSISEVDWVQGSALLTRREVYSQIGGLDEGYVMYSEEMDWCKRAKIAGWSVVYFGHAYIMHHGGKSSEQVTARKHILFQESKLRYFRKFHGLLPAQLLRTFLLLNYIWQILLEGLKSTLGHKRSMRQERIHAYWQVLRSGLKVH